MGILLHLGATMTLRIERVAGDECTVLRLVGRIESEHLGELRAQIDGIAPKVIIDIEEISLVDVESVRFLVSCEWEGAVISNASPYIREWMSREGGKGR
jgi:hypothetical protein